jgi:hypothetical protein
LDRPSSADHAHRLVGFHRLFHPRILVGGD